MVMYWELVEIITLLYKSISLISSSTTLTLNRFPRIHSMITLLSSKSGLSVSKWVSMALMVANCLHCILACSSDRELFKFKKLCPCKVRGTWQFNIVANNQKIIKSFFILVPFLDVKFNYCNIFIFNILGRIPVPPFLQNHKAYHKQEVGYLL